MNYSKKVYGVLRCTILSITLLATSVFADDENDNNLTCAKIQDDSYVSSFAELRELSVETDRKICKNMLVVGHRRDNQREKRFKEIVNEYADEASKILKPDFENSVYPLIEVQINILKKGVDSRYENEQESRTFEMKAMAGFPSEFYFKGLENGNKSIIPNAYNDECKKINATDRDKPYVNCTDALDDMTRGFNAYKEGYETYRLSGVKTQLNMLGDRWDRYLQESRSQTFFDTMLTSSIHSHNLNKLKFVEPPSTQFFIFHPHVVYENYFDAEKGDRSNIGLGVEWIGVNWWDLKVPFGVSLISVYSDYATLPSVGHGILLTLDNKYSFGFTRRDDETGLVMTIDLLKFLEDKNEKLSQFIK